jgi:hypothetical protein
VGSGTFAWRASSKSPCPICGRKKSCDSSDLELYQCITRTEDDGLPVPGFVYVGRNKLGWGLWLREDVPRRSRPRARTDRDRGAITPTNRVHHASPKIDEPRPPFGQLAGLYAEEGRKNGKIADLANRLGVLEQHLVDLQCGWERSNYGGCWTFPERSADGKVIGIGLRLSHESKKSSMRRSQRGLIFPLDLADRVANSPVAPGVRLVVEGPSDVAAVMTMGLAAVGRPNNFGGGAEIARLLKVIPKADRVIIVGEHDRKEDGHWPGQEGARRVARDAAAIGSRLQIAFPESGTKDTREYLNRHVRFPATSDKATLDDIGRRFLESLIADNGSGPCYRFGILKGDDRDSALSCANRESVTSSKHKPSLSITETVTWATNRVDYSRGPVASKLADEGLMAGDCPQQFIPLLRRKDNCFRMNQLGIDCGQWLGPECLRKNPTSLVRPRRHVPLRSRRPIADVDRPNRG